MEDLGVPKFTDSEQIFQKVIPEITHQVVCSLVDDQVHFLDGKCVRSYTLGTLNFPLYFSSYSYLHRGLRQCWHQASPIGYILFPRFEFLDTGLTN